MVPSSPGSRCGGKWGDVDPFPNAPDGCLDSPGAAEGRAPLRLAEDEESARLQWWLDLDPSAYDKPEGEEDAFEAVLQAAGRLPQAPPGWTEYQALERTVRELWLVRDSGHGSQYVHHLRISSGSSERDHASEEDRARATATQPSADDHDSARHFEQLRREKEQQLVAQLRRLTELEPGLCAVLSRRKVAAPTVPAAATTSSPAAPAQTSAAARFDFVARARHDACYIYSHVVQTLQRRMQRHWQGARGPYASLFPWLARLSEQDPRHWREQILPIEDRGPVDWDELFWHHSRGRHEAPRGAP